MKIHFKREIYDRTLNWELFPFNSIRWEHFCGESVQEMYTDIITDVTCKECLKKIDKENFNLTLEKNYVGKLYTSIFIGAPLDEDLILVGASIPNVPIRNK